MRRSGHAADANQGRREILAAKKSVTVISYGLGPIGQATARHLLSQPDLRLVGAVDIDPSKKGKTVGQLLGEPKLSGVIIRDDAESVLRETSPHVVLHTTASWLQDVEKQLLQILDGGCHVVSSTEELAYPPLVAGVGVAKRLNERALAKGRAVLPVGVNPGFVMDHVCLEVARCCLRVDRVTAERRVDATKRRGPLQKKIGSGMTVAEFEAEKGRGRLGHAGFRESVGLIAHRLGWELDGVEMTIEPVIARAPVRTEHVKVEPGQVAGIDQTAVGRKGARDVIRLHIIMSVDGIDPVDEVRIEGDPPLVCRFVGGIPGDQATVALLVDGARRVGRLRPGLLTPSGDPLFS